jgi:ankyrin repeat protein
VQNERGISPLGVAVGFNRKDMVQLLLDAGADLAGRDGQGNTVLHYAAGEGRCVCCAW